MKKLIKFVPYTLATIRAFSFVPLILSTFNILNVSLLSQIVLSTIIVTSDKYDGEISRKNNDEKNKLIFRIVDTTVDKTGILLCLIGMLITGKVSILYTSILLGYNSILLGAGAINLLTTKDKKESTVQGLSISRLFTALTGLSFLLFNNIEVSNIFQYLITAVMGTLGVSSLATHLIDKKNQNINNKPTIQCKNEITKEDEKDINTMEKTLEIVKDKKEENKDFKSNNVENKEKNLKNEKKELLELYKKSIINLEIEQIENNQVNDYSNNKTNQKVKK